MADSEFLTGSEIHQLTGYARAAQQAEWLKERRVPHRHEGRRVILARTHVLAWLEGKQQVVSSGINWASVK